jgi:hypothetical protein
MQRQKSTAIESPTVPKRRDIKSATTVTSQQDLFGDLVDILAAQENVESETQTFLDNMKMASYNYNTGFITSLTKIVCSELLKPLARYNGLLLLIRAVQTKD